MMKSDGERACTRNIYDILAI